MSDRSEKYLRYADEVLSEEEFQELERELRGDLSAREAFVRAQLLEQELVGLFEEVGASERILKGEAEVKGRSVLGGWMVAGLAAAAAIVLGVFLYIGGEDVAFDGPMVRLAMGEGFRAGEQLEVGEYAVGEGSLRLSFSSGASVAVQGPAQFEIPEEGADFKLLSGEVVVRNEGGARVRVAVDDRLLVCEGGAFGVHREGGDASKLYVLNGEVKVEDFQRRPALLEAGFAAPVEALPSGVSLMSPAERGPMQPALLIACSVSELEGVALLYASDVAYDLLDTKDNELAYLLPEKRIDLEGVIPVSLLLGLELKNSSLKREEEFQYGDAVQSYLLHMNPLHREKSEGPKRYQGHVRFEKPVLALIASRKLLDETEWLFASQPDAYPGRRGRGLEHTHGWDVTKDKKDSDVVRLSEDRRTLYFDVRVGSGIDQVRVLTQAD
ncbi:hypothetical protein [Rubritalea tangerina]|uniref:FecR protein domain-containing protein n=1 Tax=Rubritalea tangerina TaxID=430798 RepID=A0ABW4ZEI3_9BACT